MNSFVAVILIAFALLARPGHDKTVETFWLKSSAQVIAEKGSVRLTCHVPRSEDNRWVELGIEGYRSSRMDMEGENAPKTYQVLISRVPCGVGAAYCAYGGIPGSKATQTKLNLVVSGCDQ